MNLSTEESEIIKTLISSFTLRKRTGEIGIMHGLERFISTHKTFKKQKVDTLDAVFKKFGLTNGIEKV